MLSDSTYWQACIGHKSIPWITLGDLHKSLPGRLNLGHQKVPARACAQ